MAQDTIAQVGTISVYDELKRHWLGVLFRHNAVRSSSEQDQYKSSVEGAQKDLNVKLGATRYFRAINDI